MGLKPFDINDLRNETDHEEFIFNRLTGKFKHYCPEWDFLAIDEDFPEFKYCSCEFKTIWDEETQTWIKNHELS